MRNDPVVHPPQHICVRRRDPVHGQVSEEVSLRAVLLALHNSLDQLYRNGLVPDLTPATFDLPPTPSRSKSAEILYRESGNVLYGLIDP